MAFQVNDDIVIPNRVTRRFLVDGDAWREAVTNTARLCDGAFGFGDGRTARVSLRDGHATLTVVGGHSAHPAELEYRLPACDGRLLLEQTSDSAMLEKLRHSLRYKGMEWAVDEYLGALDCVVLAEIQLPHVDTYFPCPPWLGADVTRTETYRQATMMRLAQKTQRRMAN